jgi:hypothetical protein
VDAPSRDPVSYSRIKTWQCSTPQVSSVIAVRPSMPGIRRIKGPAVVAHVEGDLVLHVRRQDGEVTHYPEGIP